MEFLHVTGENLDREHICCALDGAARPPRFRDCARAQRTDCEGFILYYTCQCPFAAKYAPLAGRLCYPRN